VTELGALAQVFGRLGLLAFGGGLGILPEMERQAVEIHGWVTHREFVDAFAFSQVTPGPGMLMVVAIGFRAAGLAGALVAGLAMFGPTSLLTAFVADRWARLGDWGLMELLRGTLAPVALGLLGAGCYTLTHLGVHGPLTAGIALGALVAVGWRGWSPALVVVAGGLIGLASLR
jgi:chromate transporter